MFSISCRYLKNEEEAKDAMEDALLKAFTNLENYTEKTSFGAWLKRIMINQCLDTLKKKRLGTISLKKYPLEIVEKPIGILM